MILYVGAGGGYNERDGVEYIDRDESDEEFDEVSNLVVINQSQCHYVCMYTEIHVHVQCTCIML